MSTLEMKEIRIPAALMRERRPSVLYTAVKATFAALLLAVISFFSLNACAIAVLGIVRAVGHGPLDFSIAYRYFAAPSAVGIFLIAWIGCLSFFFGERRR
jgi:hypothetical protein